MRFSHKKYLILFLLLTLAITSIQAQPIGIGRTLVAKWNPSGTFYAVGGSPGRGSCATDISSDFDILIIDAISDTISHRLTGNRCPIYSLDWNYDGSQIAAVGNEDIVRVWNTASGSLLATYGGNSIPAFVSSINWHPTENLLLYTLNTGNSVRAGLSFVNGSQSLIVGDNSGASTFFADAKWYGATGDLIIGEQDGDVIVWDIDSNAELSLIATHPSVPNMIEISPNNQFVAVSHSFDDLVSIMDISAQLIVSQFTTSEVRGISWNPNNTQLAIATPNSIEIYDITSGQLLSTFQYTTPIFTVAWHPTSSELLVGSTDTVIREAILSQTCDMSVALGNNTELVTAINIGNGVSSSYAICLEDSSYTFNSSDNNGGYGANALPVITGDITIVGNGAIIERDITAPDFRLFRVENGGSLTLENLTIQNGVTSGTGASGDGGAIHNRGTLNLVDTTIINNTANVEGGAIYNDTNAVINITDSIISNNTAVADDGGAIDNHGSLVISGSTLEYNSSTNDDGGAIWNDSNATLSITDSILRYNTAFDFGGAIRNFGTLTINNSNIDNNTANNDGGAISSDTGVITITNGSFNNNTAVNDDGGAIITFAPVSLNNVMLEGNSSGDKGGAIYATGTDLIIENQSVFSNNVAGHNGGAIYTGSNSSTLTITDSTFSSNTTPQHGGALYLDNGTHTISNTLFQSNTAVKRGGAIFTYGNLTINLNTIFDANQASDDGGAIYANDTINITDTTFRFNSAVDQGGGVRGFVSASSFLVNSCIHDNVAGNTSGLFFASSNFDASYNWWGATDGAGGSGSGSGDAVNNNVNYSNFITTTCADAFGANGMGSQSLALAPNSVASNNADDSNTYPVVPSPYANNFDVDDAWVNTARWQRDDLAGRTDGAWIIDTSIRGQASILEMTTWVDLANSPQIRLDYADQAQLSNADLITLEIQTQGSSDWTVLNQSIGGAYSWQDRSISLSAYRGQTIRLRWRVEVSTDVPVNETSTHYAIDDLVITRR